MTSFTSRQHRLEIPPMPNTEDPAVMKRHMESMRRLMQDEFNRLSTDFYDFKKTTFEAGILPLKAPSQIELVIGQGSVVATWENPQQDSIIPTHVRVRIEELSPNEWAEYTYPLTTWETNALYSGTQYTFQVQLIARFEDTDTFVSTTRNCPSVPVQRTAESEVKAKVFTTLAGVGPPADPGTVDTNAQFPIPDTTGTPGVVGGSDCWWGYTWQYRSSCTWTDTGTAEAFVNGDAANIGPIDTASTPFSTRPNALHRMKYREICDGVADDYQYGQEFMAVDYADADCLGVVKSASESVFPYSSATGFAIPAVCMADESNLRIVNGVNDAEWIKGVGLQCIEYIDDEWTMIGKNGNHDVTLIGGTSVVSDLDDLSSFTLAFDFKQPSAYVTTGLTTAPLITIGDKIKVYYIGFLTNFDLLVHVPRDGGGVYRFRASGLSYGDWHEFYYVHDTSTETGRKLIVDNILEGQSAAPNNDNNFTGITSQVQFHTLALSQLRKAYFWNEAIEPDELSTITLDFDTDPGLTVEEIGGPATGSSKVAGSDPVYNGGSNSIDHFWPRQAYHVKGWLPLFPVLPQRNLMSLTCSIYVGATGTVSASGSGLSGAFLSDATTDLLFGIGFSQDTDDGATTGNPAVWAQLQTTDSTTQTSTRTSTQVSVAESTTYSFECRIDLDAGTYGEMYLYIDTVLESTVALTLSDATIMQSVGGWERFEIRGIPGTGSGSTPANFTNIDVYGADGTALGPG